MEKAVIAFWQSVERGALNKNIILIQDVTNLYYDFGKYKIGYEYILNKDKTHTKYLYIMNDSFVIFKKQDIAS